MSEFNRIFVKNIRYMIAAKGINVGKNINDKIDGHPIQISTLSLNPTSCFMVIGGWMKITSDYERSLIDSEIRRFKASLRHPMKQHLRDNFKVDMDRCIIQLETAQTGNTPLKVYNYFALEYSLFFDKEIDIRDYDLQLGLLAMAEKTLSVIKGIAGFSIVPNKNAR
jgi:hypothetical protein